MRDGKITVLLTSMQEIQQQVEVLSAVSLACLVLAILLFAAAVVEFFLLDIFKILLIKSGRAARMGIRELEGQNAGSGRLKSRTKKAHNLWNTDAPLKAPGNDVQSSIPAEDAQGQPAGVGISAGQSGGAFGGSPGTAGEEGTTLLEGLGSNETTLLERREEYDYSNADITMPLQEEMPVEVRKFLIVRNIMMIHTDEVI